MSAAVGQPDESGPSRSLAHLRASTGVPGIGRSPWSLAPSEVEATASDGAVRKVVAELFRGGSAELIPLSGLYPRIDWLVDRGVDRPPSSLLSTRVANGLRRAGLDGWAELSRASFAELRAIPNFGSEAAVELLLVVAGVWKALQQPETSDPGSSNVLDAPGPPEAEVGRLSLDALRAHGALEAAWADTSVILGWFWRERGAVTIADALDGSLEGAPDDVFQAVARIRCGSIAGLANLAPPGEKTWLRYLGFDGREETVLWARVLPPSPQCTLADLGEEFGVTRERVRQIENRVRVELNRRQGDPAIQHLVARVRASAGPVLSVAALDRILRGVVTSTSAPNVSPEALERRMVALRDVSGPWTGWHGLLLSADGEEVQRAVEIAIATAAPGDEVDSLTIELLRRGIADLELEVAVFASLGLAAIDGAVVRWPASMHDRAVAVLRRRGKPMSMFDIHQAVGPERNPRSLANQVQSDPRIMRRGLDLYGLREWGGEEYSGILEEIEQRIERSGGAVSLQALVEEFVREFGVSESSVRSYASDPRFEKVDGDLIRFRDGDDPDFDPSRYPIDFAAGCVRHGSEWHLRVVVDADVLRGSGRQLRRAVAVALGLEPGIARRMLFGQANVTASWRHAQPTMGSLRPIVTAEACVEGDLIFLSLGENEAHTHYIVRAVELHNARGPRRLALELGAEEAFPEEDDAFDVADALGLPPSAEWVEIRDRLVERREHELAGLVPEEWCL